jgi:hypothetical protein
VATNQTRSCRGTRRRTRRFARELDLPIDCAHKVVVRVLEFVGQPREPGVDLLTLAERRDLANSLPSAAWSAVLAKAWVLLLDLLIATNVAATWEASG